VPVSFRRSRTRIGAPSKGESRHPAQVVPAAPPESLVFLPLTAADFRSGWTLDWSPELRSSSLPTPPEQPKRPA
jgi:hypothetical protein